MEPGIRKDDERTLTKEIKSFRMGNINIIDTPGFDGKEGIWDEELIKQFLDGKFTDGSHIINANGDNPSWVIKEDGKPIKLDGIIILIDENDERRDVLKSVGEVLKQLNDKEGADKIPFVVGLTHLQKGGDRKKNINEKFAALGFQAPEYIELPFKSGTNDNTVFAHDVVVPYLMLLKRVIEKTENVKSKYDSRETCPAHYLFVIKYFDLATGFVKPLVYQNESISPLAIIAITVLVVFLLQKLLKRPQRIQQNPPDGENQI